MSKSVQISEKRSHCRAFNSRQRTVKSVRSIPEELNGETVSFWRQSLSPLFHLVKETRNKGSEAPFHSHFLTHFIILKSSQSFGLGCLIIEEFIINKCHQKIKILVVFQMAKDFLDIYEIPNLLLN